jgi:DNA-binding NtrC family response regulator
MYDYSQFLENTGNMANLRDPLDVRPILVAEDDPQVRGLFVTKLQRAGYRVREAKSGAEALRFLRSAHFRVLVLSLDMRNSDGFQILKAVKTEHPGVHVLVVSGYSNGVLLEAAQCLGATLSLGKMGAPRLLVKTVRKLLGDAN